MLSLLDVAERAQKGPKMEDKAWNMGLFRRMAELAGKYEIRGTGDGAWFSYDDELAKRVLDAGIEFLATTGVYCLTTGRVIQFTEDEVREAAKEAPRQVIVGADRDQRIIRQHQSEFRDFPPNLLPGMHAPFQETLAPLVVKNFAQIPYADYIEGFNFTNVDGREVYGMPIEAYAGRRELAWLREGVRKAGRPGMAVAYYPISTRSAVLIAPMDPDYGLRRTDGILLSILPDVKVEMDLLTAAIVYQDYGCFKINGGGNGTVGGFAGDLPGAMIEGIAKPLAAWLVYRDSFSYTGVSRLGGGTVTELHVQPELCWATSVVCNALNQHTGVICYAGGGNGANGISGPGTETHLYTIAMAGIQSALNGCNLSVFGQARARMNARKTPFEGEVMYEAAKAAQISGLNRPSGEQVLRALGEKIEGKAPEPALTITECYDLVHHRPSPAYEIIYQKVKSDVAGLGIQFE
jgi:methylamine---corrinoid protein Co-methyltransferase